MQNTPLFLAEASMYCELSLQEMWNAIPKDRCFDLHAGGRSLRVISRGTWNHDSGPDFLNVHARGCSKINGARKLQKLLGKKYLICIGDADNDIPMLDGADYAFCPADGVVAARYETVCNCADGAVADVIYKKIPEILGNLP